MISRTNTLKLIKEKVDSRANGKIKIKKPFWCEFKEGTFKHTERRRVTSLVKSGNSVHWVDDGYCMRNITCLDTQDLQKIMWGLITDKEKRDIALEHLISTKAFLTD